jgi:hypothetical protein
MEHVNIGDIPRYGKVRGRGTFSQFPLARRRGYFFVTLQIAISISDEKWSVPDAPAPTPVRPMVSRG